MGLSKPSLIELIEPKVLMAHPTSRDIYGEDPVEDLVDSIKQHQGVRSPGTAPRPAGQHHRLWPPALAGPPPAREVSGPSHSSRLSNRRRGDQVHRGA